MIIAVDLDDTLLNSNREISNFNKKAFFEAKKQGYKIAVLTLRSMNRCKRFAKQIKADFVCAFLGNMIYDMNMKKVVCERPIVVDGFKTVVDEGRDILKSWIGFETEEKSCINSKKMLKIYDRVKFVKPENLLSELNKNKVFKLSFGLEKKEQFVPEFEKIAKKHNLEMVVSKKLNFVDYFAPNTNKVNALKWLKENYPNEKIIMFGDSEPDKLSLEFADIGVAVNNASNDVKRSANEVTDSNDENGVGKYILKLLNNN